LSWWWAFFINIPIAVFVLILAPKLLTSQPAPEGACLLRSMALRSGLDRHIS
jgi:MFS family permease